jgi:hypothetical protein
MQPTDKHGKPFGWFGLLMIAIISGLIIKVIGDPLVKVMSPKIETVLEEVQDVGHDQAWRRLNKTFRKWRDQAL